MWNTIRRSKSGPRGNYGISLESLEQYFKSKFSAKELETEEIKMATAKVESRYDSLVKMVGFLKKCFQNTL